MLTKHAQGLFCVFLTKNNQKNFEKGCLKVTDTNCSVNSKKILEDLAVPFAPKDIEWRVQSAARGPNGTRLLVLPYIESRAVMARLDEVCGAFWQSDFEKILVGDKEAFQCRLSIKIGDEWITRTDAAEISDFESVKGGHSNALKRAAVQWSIARYLYDLPPFWVELKDKGEHRVFGRFKISGQEQQLKGYFDTPILPNWALPAEYQKQKPQSVGDQSNNEKQQKPQKPSQQQGQTTQELNQAEQQISALQYVKGILQALHVPIKYVPELLKRASGSTVPFENAKVEDLKKLYYVLEPVYKYVSECRNYGMGERELTYYCQITLKIKIESLHSLYFKMTSEICEETLKLVREDYAKRAV